MFPLYDFNHEHIGVDVHIFQDKFHLKWAALWIENDALKDRLQCCRSDHSDQLFRTVISISVASCLFQWKSID